MEIPEMVTAPIAVTTLSQFVDTGVTPSR